MTTQTSRQLFEQADALLSLYPRRKPRQTELRRAISASYYGLFHFILSRAADMHIGAAQQTTQRYALAYRSISHSWLRSLCSDLAKPNPPPSLRTFLPVNGISPELRSLASAVPDLQEQRYGADYNPIARFGRRDAVLANLAARRAVDSLQSAPLAEQQMFLALLLFPPRGRA